MLTRRIINAAKLARVPSEHISAIHDDDLEEFLKSIGVLSEITSGKSHCKFCRKVISLGNLQYVFPDSGNIAYICNKEPCIRSFLNYYGEHND